jgi:hypothetical protein
LLEEVSPAETVTTGRVSGESGESGDIGGIVGPEATRESLRFRPSVGYGSAI